MITQEEIGYLVELFDDPDYKVAASIDRRILEAGQEAIDGLLEIQASNSALAATAGRMVDRYSSEMVLRNLKEYAEKYNDSEADLLEGGYLICKLLTPGLKRSAFYDWMLPLTGEVLSETNELKTAFENVRIFNHIFYHRHEFKPGDPFTFNESNSLLTNVISRKTGNPIALSVLYFIAAQAGGLPIYPLCFKGGFVPAYEEKGKVLFYLNVFHEGEIFMENNLAQIVKQQGLPVDTDSFEIRKDTTILSIYMEMLSFYYDSTGDREKYELLSKAIDCLGGKRYMVIEEDEDE